MSRPFDAIRNEHGSHAPSAESAVPLVYTMDPVQRFRESLKAVGGVCRIVADETEAAESVKEITADSNNIAVSDSPLVGRVVCLIPKLSGVLHNASASEMFACDAGITGAQWAIAETGTLVLESDSERHRLASLVPPLHIVLVDSKTIVHTLGEVLRRLAGYGRDQISRTVTFITGPSRTSDIELTLAIGVHGPARLNVIVIEEVDGG